MNGDVKWNFVAWGGSNGGRNPYGGEAPIQTRISVMAKDEATAMRRARVEWARKFPGEVMRGIELANVPFRNSNPKGRKMATKKPTAAQLAARQRFAEMARSGAFKKKATKRKANPLTRVKVNSPPQRGGELTPRLVKRRKATKKAPPGYYANPATFARDKSVRAPDLPYVVQRWNASAGDWGSLASFAMVDYATQWAKAYHRKFPSTTVRVVDRY